MYLELNNLKIFQIQDGEQHYIVAETEEKAIEYFLKAMNYNDLQECDLEVREIQKDEDIQVNLSNDDDLLLELINRYRLAHERVEIINMWDLLKYILLKDKLQDRETEIPYVICSSTFN